jgi:hypothetical protein
VRLNVEARDVPVTHGSFRPGTPATLSSGA